MTTRRGYLSLLDFGAGVGQVGRALLSKDAQIRYRAYDGAGNVEKFTRGFVSFADLTLPISLPRADWVLMLEVGEHVPSALEQVLVRNVHAHNCIGAIISWAALKQEGAHHINCHSEKYVRRIFIGLGYYVDSNVTSWLRDGVQGTAPGPLLPYLRHTLLALRRWTPLTGNSCTVL